MNIPKISAVAIFSELWPIIVKHKKKVSLILIFELWVHGLAFHHLEELKGIMDLIPFLSSH